MGNIKKILYGVSLIIFIIANYNSASAATRKDFAEIKSSIITAYKNYQNVVNLEKYNIYEKTDGDLLKQVMTEVVNETPYLFYAGQEYTKEIMPVTSLVKKIILSYSKEYTKTDGSVDTDKIKETRRKINAAVNKALKNINDGMSDVEKAMVLHDYIIYNTSYTNSRSDKNRVNEAGVFIDNKANCQGYSVAYGILLKKAGINVRYIVSEEMGHMWNLVRIDNAWYNVDVTWDDPVDTYSGNDQYGCVMHNYFLGSTNSFKAGGHYGFSAKQASSVKYDKMYWKDVSGSFYYQNGRWLYMGDKGITERKRLASGTGKVLLNVTGRAFVRFNGNKYYFIAGNSIYMYDRKKEKQDPVWRAGNYYNSSYYLSQIMYSGGRVYYRVLKNRKYTTGSFSVNNRGFP